MKKIYSYLFAAVAIFAAVACDKEKENNEQEKSPIEFIAEAPAETKTELGAEAGGVYPVLWKSGDAITVNGTTFTTTGSGASAVFTTTVPGFMPAAQYDAIYPATAGTSFTAITIPNVQGGTFAEASMLVATSTTTTLPFKHLVSILKFRVPQAASKITITSTKNIAGKFSIYYASGLPKINATSLDPAYKTITLNGSFVANTDYYVAVIPQAGHNFTVHIDDLLSKTSTTNVETKRAKIMNLGVLPWPKVRINVKVWPYYHDWANWAGRKPQIHYWGTVGSTTWTGVNLTENAFGNKEDFYYEFDYSTTKNVAFCINNGIASGTSAEQSHDSPTLTLNKNYNFEVYTEWDHGKLKLVQN